MKKILVSMDLPGAKDGKPYRPQLTALTFPLQESWAKANGYEYQRITQRRWEAPVPITGEKMQMRELVSGFDFALFIDADILLRPDTPDPSGYGAQVVTSYCIPNAERFFKGISKGVAGGFVGAAKSHFGIWDYPESTGGWVEAVAACDKPHIIDEYLISRNIERMRANVGGICHDVDARVVHLGSEMIDKDGHDAGVDKAKEILEDWRLVWPS